jgi:chromosome segregation ATPase
MAAVVALLVAAGVQLDTVRRLDRARADADAAEVELALARRQGDDLDRRLRALGASVATARGELRAALDEQAGTAVALEEADRFRAGLAAEYERVHAELASVREVLLVADREAEVSARLVADLAGCLNGVSQFLNQLSVGDGDGALATAGRIEGPCAAVGVAFGP